ncbi:hypothetical protein K432DRAFT_429549 [Lepidopterella palustris CBS 459.81]|uniref:Uncharacterized protein n=1 Tax=Lepidopterella palustris CBS 459.81 TaxID=1314670 RepID=A0A8E2E0R7_9PEZI|nr:hypothetical protein K432DRAFT_429549 [Lepidopterella palustris CBS 459.81]
MDFSTFVKSELSLRKPQGKERSYIEPEYFEESTQHTILHGFRSRQQKAELIRWICVPYFSVEEGSSIARSAINPPIFLNTGYLTEGKYFQVAQLWCIIFGDSTLITCARKSMSDLPQHEIKIKALPPANLERRAVGDRSPIIVVSDGGIRTWLFPVEDCKTWVEFIAHFTELSVDFPNSWDLLYKNTKLRRKDWPIFISHAQRSSVRLLIQKNEENNESADDSNESDDSSILGDDDDVHGPQSNATEGGKPDIFPPMKMKAQSAETEFGTNNAGRSAKPIDTWHVFTAQHTLTVDSDDIDHYLASKNKRLGESTAYVECPTKTFQEVKDYVSSLGSSEHMDLDNVSTSELHLLKAAMNILSLFFPLHYEHKITQKYWGAIDRILRESSQRSPRFLRVVWDVRRTSRTVRDLKDLFSSYTPAENQIEAPWEFMRAWMFCLMYFILYSTEGAGKSPSYQLRCRALLRKGKSKVLQGLQIMRLRDREAVSPLGISSLLIFGLLRDLRDRPVSFTVAARYWRDIQQLTTEIQDNPLGRGYLDVLMSLKRDIDTIIIALEQQQRVLDSLTHSIKESDAKRVPAQNTNKLNGEGLEARVAGLSLRATEEALQSFIEMSGRVTELESWVVFLRLFYKARS